MSVSSQIVVKMSFEGQILSSTYTYESMKVTVSIRPLSDIVLVFQNNSRITLSVEGFKLFKHSIYSQGMDLDQEADMGYQTRIGSNEGKELKLYIRNGIVMITHNEVILYETSVDYWRKFFRLYNSVISCKIDFLEKYSAYANKIHRRIVSYYIEMLHRSENVDFFTLDYVRENIITLDNNALPKNDVKCDYSALDFNVCFLINGEIRLNIAHIIYLDVKIAFVSSEIEMLEMLEI